MKLEASVSLPPLPHPRNSNWRIKEYFKPCFGAARVEKVTESLFLCWELHPDKGSNILSYPEASCSCSWTTVMEVCAYGLLGTCAQAVPLLCTEDGVGWVV